MDNRILFPKSTEFTETLKSRVDEYFRNTQKKITGDRRLYLKTCIGYMIFLASYIYGVFFADTLFGAIIAAFCFAQGSILIAFNVMHDGAHGSYSTKKWVNNLMGATMDILGGSQFLWKFKHNILHHTFTNIDGKDDDLESMNLLRFSPRQKWRSWHRYQYIYAPFLYGMLTIFWFFSDFPRMFQGKININPTPKITYKTWIYFFMLKGFYIFFMLVLPSLFHSFGTVVIFFIGIHIIFGFTLSVIFSLAHVEPGVDFPIPKKDGFMEYEWFIHQLSTTTDFAPKNILANWYMGGLNNQVTHHLFQQVSHIHYPALRQIIEKTCREYGIQYNCIPSFRTAVFSHFQHLWTLSYPPKSL